MAWVAVDRDGDEAIFYTKPIKSNINGVWHGEDYYSVALPSGTIQQLIGKKLTWDDKPVKLKRIKHE